MISFFRLLILGLFFYIAAKLVASLFSAAKSRTEVRGRSKSKPLDLSDKDVEDVDFKERED